MKEATGDDPSARGVFLYSIAMSTHTIFWTIAAIALACVVISMARAAFQKYRRRNF
jgi:hypothetical protein